VVEKVVVQREGVTEEELREAEERARAAKETLHKKAQEATAMLLAARDKTEEERMRLAAELERKAAAKQSAAREQELLAKKLRAMEEKLLIGGQMMDKAAKQEQELRKARMEMEERRKQEAALNRELKEREDAKLQLNERFSSLQEEADVKTKKLQKLFQRFQSAQAEIRDLQEEFQREREDMAHTIRELDRELKLKQALIDSFVPPATRSGLEGRAVWDAEEDEWRVRPLHPFQGNPLKPARPRSVDGEGRCPVTLYALQRQQYDANPRFKHENVILLDLDMPERTTQDYAGVDMETRVEEALEQALQSDDEDEVVVAAPETLPGVAPAASRSGGHSRSRGRASGRY